MAEIKNQVILNYIYRSELDTLTDYSDSLFAFLNSTANSIEDHIALTNLYLWYKDTTNAAYHINIISDNPLDSEVTYFKLWANLYKEIVGEEKNWFQLDSIQEVTLRNIALSTTRSGLAARGVLGTVFDEHYQYDVIYAELDSNSLSSYSAVPKTNIQSTLLTIYPNPASEFIKLSYSYPKSRGQITIDIIDISGHVLKNIKAQGWNTTIEINTSDLSHGTYFLQIRDQYKSLGVEKFAILK